jgi:hypothetical protein
MATTVTKSLLLSKLGNTFIQAHNANKGVKPRENSDGDLPEIRNGVARLVQCKIMEVAKGKKNEGKLMFYAAGTVLAPEYVDGYKTRGKFTKITEPIYDTPTRTRKTVNDHIKWIYELLEGLGMKTAELSPDRVEDGIRALLLRKPTFEFRVWHPPMQTEGPYAGKKSQPMHFWYGLTDYKPPVQTNGAMKDETENIKAEDAPPPPDEPDNEPEHNVTQTQEPSAFEKTIGTKVEPSTNGVQSNTTVQEVDPANLDKSDIDSLAKRAEDNRDLQAAVSLQEMAVSAGISQEEINQAKSWYEVVDKIKGKQGEDGVTISVGDHWMYAPINAATKQKMSARTVEISAINDNDTVNLTDVQIPRIKYNNISVNDLEPVK